MALTQREAVYQAVVNTLADSGINFDDGQTPSAQSLLTKDTRKIVVNMVVEGFLAGNIQLSDGARTKFDTQEKVRSYVGGLVNNWLRKDKRLNGNSVYVTQNPGSRAGSGDEQLKALKELRRVKAGDAEAVQAIDGAIESRLQQLAAEKAKSVTISEAQLSLIPADLRSKLGI